MESTTPILITIIKKYARGLGTTGYGQAVLVLALIAIIFRTLHARNSDVTLLMLKKYGEKMFTLSHYPSVDIETKVILSNVENIDEEKARKFSIFSNFVTVCPDEYFLICSIPYW